MSLIRIITILFCVTGYGFFYNSNILAQSPLLRFQHVGVENGLSNKTVYTIAQDQDGFILMGTAKGLNRFDGSRVIPYGDRNNPDIRLLNASEITFIQNDNQQNLWIGTDRAGLFCFAQSSGTPIRFHSLHAHKDYKFGGDNIRKGLGFSKNGNIWISDDGKSLTEIGKNKKILRRVPLFEGNINIRFVSAFTDSTLLLGTFSNGVYLFNLRSLSISPWLSPELKGLDISEVLCEPQSSSLWVCSSNGLYLFDYRGKKINHYTCKGKTATSIPVNNITGILRDNQQRLWIATYGGGIALMEAATGSFHIYKHNLYNSQTLSGDEVLDIFQDVSGKIWVGTHKSGLSYFNPEACNFEIISTDSPLFPRTGDNNIKKMIKISADEILFLTEKGLSLYHEEKKTIRNFPLPHPDLPAFTLLLLQNRKIILAAENGLFYFQPENGKYSPVFTPEENKKPVKITALFEDSKGNLWMGGDDPKSLFVFHKDAKTIKTLTSDDIPDTHINTFFEDRSGNLYAGTWIGAFRFNYENQRFDNSKIGNINYSVISFFEDEQGNLEMGTYLEGLYILNRQTGKVTQLNRTNLLPDDNVLSVQSHRKENYWIATDRGLCLLIKEKKQSQNDTLTFKRYWFNPENGFPYSQTTGLLFSKNKLYVGTLNGVVHFYPDSLTIETPNAPIVITSLRIMDKEIPIHNQDSISVSLTYLQNFLEIEYAQLNFQPSHHEYATLLKNFDSKWYPAYNKQSVSFSNLSGGKYWFMIKSRNNDGTWGESQQKIQIIVYPPFWKTYWFLFLIIALFLGIVYAIYWNRIAKIKKEEALKTQYHKEISEMQVKLLRSRMNPHFLFNGLNAINHYIQKNEGDIASEYLADFARLMRMLLDNSQYACIPLSKEIEMLQLYLKFEAMRFSEGFRTEVVLDKSIKSKEILIPGMIIQPYVENAIWHGLRHKSGKDGLLTVLFSAAEGLLYCIVTDNGVGRKKSEEINQNREKHLSHGLKITQERLAFLAKEKNMPTGSTTKDLTDAAGNVCGTQVEIRLPIEDEF